jgi:hypothetical protein
MLILIMLFHVNLWRAAKNTETALDTQQHETLTAWEKESLSSRANDNNNNMQYNMTMTNHIVNYLQYQI